MKLHEYQVKKILSEHEVNVVLGNIAYTPNEAFKIASEIKGNGFFVKAQSIGLGPNSVFLTKNKTEVIPKTVSAMTPKDVLNWSSFMFGNILFADGKEQEIRKVYIEKSYKIKKTMYLSMMYDSKKQSLVFVSFDGAKGKTVIETVTTSSRPKIDVFRKVFMGLGLESQYLPQVKELLKSLYKALITLDILKIEITELILTNDNNLLVKEVDVFFDEASSSRQKEIFDLIDLSEMTKEKELAYKWGVRYIPYTGNISVMTNGVGLGLAIADTIKLSGGNPAHIIDIGWNADKTRIVKAFQLVLRSSEIDGLLIYVYGGSLHCDEVARGIIAAIKEMSLEMPLVVRLGGTNEDIAENLLKSSGLPIIIAKDIASSCDLIVKKIEGAL